MGHRFSRAPGFGLSSIPRSPTEDPLLSYQRRKSTSPSVPGSFFLAIRRLTLTRYAQPPLTGDDRTARQEGTQPDKNQVIKWHLINLYARVYGVRPNPKADREEIPRIVDDGQQQRDAGREQKMSRPKLRPDKPKRSRKHESREQQVVDIVGSHDYRLSE
jgi:hypothetical protein